MLHVVFTVVTFVIAVLTTGLLIHTMIRVRDIKNDIEDIDRKIVKEINSTLGSFGSNVFLRQIALNRIFTENTAKVNQVNDKLSSNIAQYSNIETQIRLTNSSVAGMIAKTEDFQKTLERVGSVRNMGSNNVNLDLMSQVNMLSGLTIRDMDNLELCYKSSNCSKVATSAGNYEFQPPGNLKIQGSNMLSLNAGSSILLGANQVFLGNSSSGTTELNNFVNNTSKKISDLESSLGSLQAVVTNLNQK